MAINQAFLGHSLFTELSVQNVLDRYGGYQSPNPHPAPRDAIDRFIFAVEDMQIANVWIQLFTRPKSDAPTDFGECDPDSQTRAALIQRLHDNNIKWAGWGYCAGKYWQKSLTLIDKLHHDLGMSAFIIDAEPGNKVYKNPNDPNNNLPDLWADADFDTFTGKVMQEFGKDNVALTTWGVLQTQDNPAHGVPLVALMRTAAPRVCAFVPQAYWESYPGQAQYKHGFSPNDYPPDDPVAYVRLVIKAWTKLGFTTPLIVAGQAFWDKSEDTPPQATMIAKAKDFATRFLDWPQIPGFAWYNAGKTNSQDEGGMADAMIAAIAAAKLGNKPYKKPAAGA